MDTVEQSARHKRFTDHNNRGGAEQRVSDVPYINNSYTLKPLNNVPAPSRQFHFISPPSELPDVQWVSHLQLTILTIQYNSRQQLSLCSLVDTCWLLGTSGLLYRLVSALEITALKCGVVSYCVYVFAHFFLFVCLMSVYVALL